VMSHSVTPSWQDFPLIVSQNLWMFSIPLMCFDYFRLNLK
jgi:hypothetical protein